MSDLTPEDLAEGRRLIAEGHMVLAADWFIDNHDALLTAAEQTPVLEARNIEYEGTLRLIAEESSDAYSKECANEILTDLSSGGWYEYVVTKKHVDALEAALKELARWILGGALLMPHGYSLSPATLEKLKELS